MSFCGGGDCDKLFLGIIELSIETYFKGWDFDLNIEGAENLFMDKRSEFITGLRGMVILKGYNKKSFGGVKVSQELKLKNGPMKF